MAERCARIALLLVLLCSGSAVLAQGAIEAFEFATPQEAARYRMLTEELRCPKCINTNLAGSDSPIAADLRATVFRLIRGGASDQAVRDYLQARYGDFVLYDPPVRRDTLVLWLAPALLLVVGLGVIALMVLRRREGKSQLTDVETARLNQLLGDARSAAAADLTKDPT
jgi:cytochrome c-type biogenesis protein CcmH